MTTSLPNLELLEYQCKLALQQDENWKTKLGQIRAEKGRVFLDFDCIVFPQTWSSTATAFDCEWGGQGFTKAYTVVFHESVTDVYVVFVDNRICYMVDNSPQAFLDDLRERKLASLNEAKEKYL